MKKILFLFFLIFVALTSFSQVKVRNDNNNDYTSKNHVLKDRLESKDNKYKDGTENENYAKQYKSESKKRTLSTTQRISSNKSTLNFGAKHIGSYLGLSKMKLWPKEVVYITKDVVDSSFAYYSNFVKKNGWLHGIDKPLTKIQASHQQVYYKFSNKNKAGKWTKMQAYNGFHRLTCEHNVGTYLVNQFDISDSNVDEAWRNKLKTVCQWEFIGDNSGNEIIQEIGLDEYNNVVYVYIPVRNGKKIYGGFFDEWGKPISLRAKNDSTQNEANYVSITLDKNGYEHILEFTDKDGYRKYNKDGVYATRYTYDDGGHKLKEESLDMLGNPTIDSWGNCGFVNTFDKNGNVIESYYIDNLGEPMRMPAQRSGSHKVVKIKYTYDKWGRNISQKFYTFDNIPDIDSLTYIDGAGVHEYRSSYNERGQCTEYASFDTNGTPVPLDSTGIARVVRNYDSNGNQIFFGLYDSKGEFVNNEQGTCMSTSKYNKQDLLLEEIGYTCIDESVLLDYEYHRDGNIKKTYYYYYGKDADESYVKIDSVDVNDELLKREYYSLKDSAIEVGGYHRYICQKRRLRPHVWEIRKDYLGKDGKHTEPNDENWAFAINIEDSVEYKTNIRQFDEDSTVVEAFQKYYADKEQTELLGQRALTPLGNIGRSAGSTGYYKTEVTRTPNGDICTFMNYNEWGEPSYIETSNHRVFCYRLDDATSMKLYDENMVEIENTSSFWQTLPQAYCIELTDIKAYNAGLRDGDIIVRYGNWFKEKPVSRDEDIFEDDFLGLEMILSANQEKTMWVLRHNIMEGSSSIIEIKQPKGTPSELGFDYIPIFYNKHEVARYSDAVEKYLASSDLDVSILRSNANSHVGDREVFLAKPKKVGIKRSSLYRKGVHNPAILTGIKKKVLEDDGIVEYTWNTFTDDEFKFKDRLYKEENEMMLTSLYLSEDLKTNKEAVFGFRGGTYPQYMVDIVTVKVNDDVYNMLFKQCNTGLADEDSIPTEEPLRTPMELYSYLTSNAVTGINTMHINESIGSLLGQLEEKIGISLAGCEIYLIHTDKEEMPYKAKRKYQAMLNSINVTGYSQLESDDNNKIYVRENKKNKEKEFLHISDEGDLFIVSGNMKTEDFETLIQSILNK